MTQWLNLIITTCFSFISDLIKNLIQVFIKKEKGFSFKRFLIVILILAGIVGFIVFLTNSPGTAPASSTAGIPTSDTQSSAASAGTVSTGKESSQASAPDKVTESSQTSVPSTESSQPSPQSTVLQFAGAAQSRTHNAGPGHKTSASVLVKKIEFAEDYTIVEVQVENNGDSDLTVNTVEIHGSTVLIVNGKSYAYVKHNGDSIVSGTTQTSTFYFERCPYQAGDSIALNFHLGLPLQFNLKDLQNNIK